MLKKTSFLLLVLLLLTLLVFFLSINKKNNWASSKKIADKKYTNLNQFPISTDNKMHILFCLFDKFIIYNNYQSSPQLPEDWRSVADLQCSYLNSKNQLQQLLIPVLIYNEQTETSFFIGSDFKSETLNNLLEIIPTFKENYFTAVINSINNITLQKDYKIALAINFPTNNLAQNNTKGIAFDTLESENPPYTRNTLEKFYQTGNVNLLPKINNHYYFWPLIKINFNVIQN